MTATGPIDTSLDVAKNWTVDMKERLGVEERESYAVNQNANERRVQAVFWREGGDLGV